MVTQNYGFTKQNLCSEQIIFYAIGSIVIDFHQFSIEITVQNLVVNHISIKKNSLSIM